MTREIWRPVVGYEGLYEVSDQGRVRSLDRHGSVLSRWGEPMLRTYQGRVLKQGGNGKGYFVVQLCDETGRAAYLVHRLVALAFLPLVPGKPFVNHKDGSKANNLLSNIEWCDRSENMLHASAAGLLDSPKMPVIGTCLRTGRETRFNSQMDAEIALSGTRRKSSAIHHCLIGKKQSAYGYVWKAA